MTGPKKILIIEDDPVIQGLISDILKPRGFELSFANDGEEGFKLAQAIQPHLILLDIIMPKMDGLTVQMKLKEIEQTKNIPVVFITARTTLSDTMRALSHGAAGYIEKPFDMKRFLRKVEALLQ